MAAMSFLGPGVKIVNAESDGVDALEEVASRFMEQVFGFEGGSYLITDESTLYDFTAFDFTGAGNHESIEEVKDLITRLYRIDPVPVNLLEIFRLLAGPGTQ